MEQEIPKLKSNGKPYLTEEEKRFIHEESKLLMVAIKRYFDKTGSKGFSAYRLETGEVALK